MSTDDLERAFDALTRYLAIRDHSEVELRKKLKKRFEDSIIERALEWAHEHRMIAPPEELAARTARELTRKKKSQRYIQSQLRARGLPEVLVSDDDELTKMRALLLAKFGEYSDLTFEEKTKALRFLQYRGFSNALIRRVLNEKNEGDQ